MPAESLLKNSDRQPLPRPERARYSQRYAGHTLGAFGARGRGSVSGCNYVTAPLQSRARKQAVL